MRNKPMIGLKKSFALQEDSPAFTFISAGYYDAIAAVGGIPVVCRRWRNEEDLNSILGLLDGVVLVGGADLDLCRDGFMLHPTIRPMESRREDFDRLLINRLVADMRLPLFGIGAGMQLLNLQQGGNLFLHIPEDLPKAIPHKDPMDAAHRHGLEVVPGWFLMERVYGDGEIRVNSLHQRWSMSWPPDSGSPPAARTEWSRRSRASATIGSPSARSSIPKAIRPRHSTCESSKNFWPASRAKQSSCRWLLSIAAGSLACRAICCRPRASSPGTTRARRIPSRSQIVAAGLVAKVA